MKKKVLKGERKDFKRAGCRQDFSMKSFLFLYQAGINFYWRHLENMK